MKHYITDEDIDRVSIKIYLIMMKILVKVLRLIVNIYWIVQRLIIIVMNVVYF